MQILVSEEEAEEELMYNKSVALEPILMVDIHAAAFPGSEVVVLASSSLPSAEAVINRN